ncbi:MAG: hypothetical protein A3F24_00045 [Candidatus Colwellbacteria bacterium RIFCSPHIGHO2_12_FULL_44_17]|uniref:Uncharacterized protein n=2 Tax=Candidatus Colwelliibacteriota TaxID=1817904 RepID=A0A1G1Z5A5_9BACT|nr:MAG: hypothetical protein A3F24_00045 [Candidatus Colwellbacteria bacterium RIFCSPHIGHO2_12_FULL_44_17]OGY59793.1 MAG: hypothetical protein A3I31_01140 [Candidatus Colwellbacteria bacterium RIFCSPLOWO2_02_FULL_44_20b]
MTNGETSGETSKTPNNKPFSDKTHTTLLVIFLCMGIAGFLLFVIPTKVKNKETEKSVSTTSITERPPLSSEGCAPTPVSPKAKKILETKVTLLGENQKTRWNKDVPPRTDYFFWGPEGTKVEFEDGTIWNINDCFGERRPVVRFWGPTGKKVTIAAYMY